MVDQETVDYYLDVLPPAYWTSSIIQAGEPTMHLERGALYPTLMRVLAGWAYAGDCYRGETVDRTAEINEAIRKWNRGD